MIRFRQAHIFLKLYALPRRELKRFSKDGWSNGWHSSKTVIYLHVQLYEILSDFKIILECIDIILGVFDLDGSDKFAWDIFWMPSSRWEMWQSAVS